MTSNRRITASAGAYAALLGLVVLSGCASPGLPRAPSLNLPAPAAALEAERVGGEVRLRWTTPDETTDGLPIRGKITAELCRGPASNGAEDCRAIRRVAVQPGPSEVTDALPPPLTEGAAQLLGYRVTLRNAVERSAGPSPVALVASGAAPGSVAALLARAVPEGALLQWQPERLGDPVELRRTMEVGPGQPPRETAEVILRVDTTGAPDPGGTLDRGARPGGRFRYTAQRVRKVMLSGHTLELRSAPSAPVAVDLRDIFPPDAPRGLEAVADTTSAAAAIDLSWQPGSEPDLASYLVFRQEAGELSARQIGPERVTEPAFRDSGVLPGHTYIYTVVAVDKAGNRSVPSAAASEKLVHALP